LPYVFAVADVLDVVEHHVDAIEHGFRWMARRAVEAVYRKPGTFVDVRFHVRSRRLIAAQSVLRRVDRFQRDRRIATDRIDDRFQACRDTGLIRYDADAAAPEIAPRLREKHFVAERHVRRR
jgi:hypothetical protein